MKAQVFVCNGCGHTVTTLNMNGMLGKMCLNCPCHEYIWQGSCGGEMGCSGGCEKCVLNDDNRVEPIHPVATHDNSQFVQQIDEAIEQLLRN